MCSIASIIRHLGVGDGISTSLWEQVCKKFKNTQQIWSEASQKVHLESEFKQSIV